MAHFDNYVTKLQTHNNNTGQKRTIDEFANIEVLLASLTKLMNIIPRYLTEGSIDADKFISPIHWEDKTVLVATPPLL
jgi:hypothetical protein